jgi:hypothetical protein
METPFKIKSYSLGELAQLYFPNITKRGATNQLRQWIFLNKKTSQQLKNSGYITGQKLLTPTQVKIIITEFGEP